MPISKPHSALGANNKGSCSNLALYLEKENQDLDKLIKYASSTNQIFDLESRKQSFFSALETNVSTIDVISAIDKNKRKLGANDAKYFAPTISFSEKELDHIAFQATDKKGISSVWDLNATELNEFNRLIRDYGRKIMDNYALNFNRQDKGIKSGSDLVYFAKIEHFRKFKGIDKDVLDGKETSGSYKKGLQSHIHVIVSRKDKTQRLKLSPTCNETLTIRTIGDNNYQVGFDRVKWIETNEKTFDEHFKYSRTELEKFQNQNILKNGSPQEKLELHKLILSSSVKQKKDVLTSKEDIIHQSTDNKEIENQKKGDKIKGVTLR